MTVRNAYGRVTEELSAIPGLSRSELVERWESAYGRLPPKGISRRLLEYIAGYQLQVKAFGGLKPTIWRKLRGQAASKEKSSVPASAPRKSTVLSPGTRLVREWHGRTHAVEVLETGFIYDGEIYGSLSKVAQVVTGARWSGPRFFGL